MQIETNFTSTFPILILFVSFSCLIALARTSSTMLNERGKGGNPCLAPDLRGNVFNFLLLSILVVGFQYMAFIMLKFVPSMPSLLSVKIMNRCLTLSNAFYVSFEMIK